MHPFEQAGLDKAPFSFEGVEYVPDGDQCEYCGQRIKYRYWILGGTGVNFTVGSECVKKTDPDMAKECEKALREYKREQTIDRELTDQEKEFFKGFQTLRLDP